MRILMYTPRFFPDPLAGGRSVSVRNLARALVEKGVHVEIASYWQGAPSKYVDKGLKVHRIFPLTNIGAVDYSLRLLSEYKARRFLSKAIGDFDILHVHGPTYGFRFPPRLDLVVYKGWRVACGKIPLVYHYHGSLGEETKSLVKGYRRFLKNVLDDIEASSRVVVLNEKTAKALLFLNIKKDVDVVYNFVSDMFLKEYDDLDSYPEQFTVLYTGGTLSYKGYGDVLKIKKMLGRIDPEIRFVMIGPGIRKVPHEQMPQVYLSASVLLFPSHREGLPLAVMEAQALKRPVVASNVGGIPEIVVHGETGFLAPPRSVNKFVDYILYLKENPNLIREMGEKARARIKQKFSKEKTVSRLIGIYKELI